MGEFSTLLQQGNAWFFIPSAILLGVLHGLEPGHSKTMMAAFIIAIKGTIKQAVMLGLAATLSHTAVVWLIALGGMYISKAFTAQAVEPWLQFVSAIIILGTAFWMFWRTWQGEQNWLAQTHHDHDHGHKHTHAHGHFHRSFRDIRRMIQESSLEEEVKDLSLRIFTRVAQAEAKVHHKDVEEVQFHEVGAVDSIVDIVGSAILIHMIHPDRICASVVQDGHGFIHCQHGMLSVPVPAVCEIFSASNAVLRQIDVDTELVTPTGAAIISELAESFGTMPSMKIEKMGWGAGTKVLKIPNLLKVTLGYEAQESSDYTQTDEIMVMQSNLDDCTGEMLGAAMEVLLEHGALDVFYTPVYMKKNRPAWCLTVLAKPEDVPEMEKLMFEHTTTIGIRRYLSRRTILKREKSSVQTPYGELQVKKVKLEDGYREYPEYESAKKLAVETGKPLWEILNHEGKSGELV